MTDDETPTGLNDQGRADRAAANYAAGTLMAAQAIEEERARAERQFEWETNRCRACATSKHQSSVCAKHREKFGIPE